MRSERRRTLNAQGRGLTPAALRTESSDPVRTLIAPDGWKLNCSPLGEHELYCLRDDPGECRNLYLRNRGKAHDLRDAILRWQERTDDTVALPA